MEIKPYSKNAKKLVKCYVCGIGFYGIRNRQDRICKKCVLSKLKENYNNNKTEKIQKAKEYRDKNKELIKIRRRFKYLKDREIILKRVKDYYNKNKDKIAITSKEYRRNNIESILISNRNRKNKLRALSVNSDITNTYLAELLKNSLKCPICGSKYINKSDKHIDHIIPISVGGEHCKDNIRVICKRCNLTRPKDGRDIK